MAHDRAGPRPLHQFHEALDSVFSNLGSNWGGLGQQLHREVGRAAAGARLFPMHLRRQQQLFSGSFGVPALAVSYELVSACRWRLVLP